MGLYIAFIKYMQSDKQVNLTREIFESTNRPYLAIDKLKYKYDEAHTLILDIDLYNFGNLPAKIYRLYWELIIHTQRKMFVPKHLQYETIYPKKSKKINSPSGNFAEIAMDNILSKETNLPVLLILDVEYLFKGV